MLDLHVSFANILISRAGLVSWRTSWRNTFGCSHHGMCAPRVCPVVRVFGIAVWRYIDMNTRGPQVVMCSWHEQRHHLQQDSRCSFVV